jgi:hypothetical protein
MLLLLFKLVVLNHHLSPKVSADRLMETRLTIGSDTMLNYHLSQKLKIIGNNKFNNLINILISIP